MPPTGPDTSSVLVVAPQTPHPTSIAYSLLMGGGFFGQTRIIIDSFLGGSQKYDNMTVGQFHVKGPRKRVNVEKWIFFNEM